MPLPGKGLSFVEMSEIRCDGAESRDRIVESRWRNVKRTGDQAVVPGLELPKCPREEVSCLISISQRNLEGWLGSIRCAYGISHRRSWVDSRNT